MIRLIVSMMTRTHLLVGSLLITACAGDRTPVAVPTPSASAPPASAATSAAPAASSAAPPAPPPLPGDATAIVAAHDWSGFPFGDSMECVLRGNGDVACAHVEIDRPIPEFRPSAFRDTVMLAAGESFVCALDRSGVVRCIGDDPCTHYLESGAPALEPGAKETPRVLHTAVAITELRINEATILMRGADQKIYVAGLHSPVAKCAVVTTKPVPDVRSFVHMWTHGECSLDARGATTCRTAPDGAVGSAMTLTGFPAKSSALVSGQSDFEGGPTFCAIGSAGELACAGLKGSFTSGAALRVTVPPASDARIGAASLRVLTTTGDVYDQWLMKTPPPAHRGCPGASRRTLTKIALDEPIAAITSGSCMLARSGKIVCVRPGCE